MLGEARKTIGMGGKRTVYDFWYLNHYGHVSADSAVKPFLDLPDRRPWLKMAREAKFLSVTEMAKRLGITVAAYRKMEISESEGKIKLDNLARCAEVMDCELVYAIRPKNRQIFSDSVWKTLVAATGEQSLVKICMTMYDVRFRFKQGWGRNTSSESHDYLRLLRANRNIKRASVRP